MQGHRVGDAELSKDQVEFFYGVGNDSRWRTSGKLAGLNIVLGVC